MVNKEKKATPLWDGKAARPCRTCQQFHEDQVMEGPEYFCSAEISLQGLGYIRYTSTTLKMHT